MDGEPEKEENEVKNDTEWEVSPVNSNVEDIAADNNGHEGVSAEIVASDYDEKISLSRNEEAPVEEAAISEPEDNSGNVENLTTSEDLAVGINEENEEPVSHEESVVFEINSNDDDESPRLHLDTPERENISPTRAMEVEAQEEEPSADPAEREDVRYEEYMQLFQELCEERDKANQHGSQLQIKLAEYFRKKAGDDTQLERELPVSEQLQEYEKLILILTELQQQLDAAAETAQQQAEQLSRQSQEKLDKVENEWRAFVALKQDVAVTLLSRRLGKQAAQVKVESALATEQLQQDELIKLRLKHITLRARIHRLEAELRDGEQQGRDSVQLQFEQLQAQRLELKKQAEKQNEESLEVQKKISSSLEVLSNIKEKLCWSQMEVQAKREQLAEVEATVAKKRDLLSRTKQAHQGLQRDNLRLKESRGLLGNRVLLRDFEDTVDASEHLETRLENLKGRQTEILFSCGRWQKKHDTM